MTTRTAKGTPASPALKKTRARPRAAAAAAQKAQTQTDPADFADLRAEALRQKALLKGASQRLIAQVEFNRKAAVRDATFLASRMYGAPSFLVKKPGDSVLLEENLRTRQRRVLSVSYTPSTGVNAFLHRVSQATPMEMIEAERHGIAGIFLKDLSKSMDLPATRIYAIVGIPKATAEKKIAANDAITGSSGEAALGLARLLVIARRIIENSTASEAQNFDAAKWLGRWIELPQPALGGHKPADLIGTPTGLEMVTRVLGAIESGAYQ